MLKNKIGWSLVVAMVFIFSAFYFSSSARAAQEVPPEDDSSSSPSCVLVSRVCSMVGGSSQVVDILWSDVVTGYPNNGQVYSSTLICYGPHTNSPDFNLYMSYMHQWSATGGGGNNYITCKK